MLPGAVRGCVRPGGPRPARDGKAGRINPHHRGLGPRRPPVSSMHPGPCSFYDRLGPNETPNGKLVGRPSPFESTLPSAGQPRRLGIRARYTTNEEKKPLPAAPRFGPPLRPQSAQELSDEPTEPNSTARRQPNGNSQLINRRKAVRPRVPRGTHGQSTAFAKIILHCDGFLAGPAFRPRGCHLSPNLSGREGRR